MPTTKNAAADAALAKLESAVDAIHLQRPTTVGEIMTKNVETCHDEEPVERCAQIMWDRNCGCVPIVDDARRPIAMITDRDICMAAYIQGKPLGAILVASAMSARIFTVNVLDTISNAEMIMRRHCLHRLPVVNASGELVGLLSVDDITQHAHFRPILGKEPLSVHAIAETVAALGHPASKSA